jgi:hypothetical protein
MLREANIETLIEFSGNGSAYWTLKMHFYQLMVSKKMPSRLGKVRARVGLHGVVRDAKRWPLRQSSRGEAIVWRAKTSTYSKHAESEVVEVSAPINAPQGSTISTLVAFSRSVTMVAERQHSPPIIVATL